MITVPMAPERTPMSGGFFLCLVWWLLISLICVLSNTIYNAWLVALVYLDLMIAPINIIWTLIDTICGRKWALLGFVLSTVVPAAAWIYYRLPELW